MENFDKIGKYYCRDGMAKERGMRSLCKKKLCFSTTDKDFLFGLMNEISQANDCFLVKISIDDRQGVFFGYSFFTNDSSLGDAWAKFESHPKVWAVIHDDEFCEPFKNSIRSY